jgi:hypothetical protein
MKNEYLKTLWMLRFVKIKETEDAAAWGYQEVMDECLTAFGSHDKGVLLLRNLIAEERMHAKLAEELIKICHRNHPEFNALSIDE